MKLYQLIKRNQILSYLFYSIRDRFSSRMANIEEFEIDGYWKARIDDVLACPDLHKIVKHQEAGAIINNCQIMHNGLKIFLGSYYGYGNAFWGMHEMLRLSKGVHEPQEEFVFQEILKRITPGSLMLELGSYWSFYSMWFNKSIKGAVNYMIEPDARCLYSGKKNFKINGIKGKFFQYYIGDSVIQDTVITVDSFIENNQIQSLSILHSDIQGHELSMLKGAQSSLKDKKIEYLFISTHSNELHAQCISFLKSLSYNIVCESDLNTTFSYDGLIVASIYDGLKMPISLKSKK